jgi:hypothetical protein
MGFPSLPPDGFPGMASCFAGRDARIIANQTNVECGTYVGQTFLSAGVGDFPVARACWPRELGQELRQNREQESEEPAGWKTCPTSGGDFTRIADRYQ